MKILRQKPIAIVFAKSSRAPLQTVFSCEVLPTILLPPAYLPVSYSELQNARVIGSPSADARRTFTKQASSVAGCAPGALTEWGTRES